MLETLAVLAVVLIAAFSFNELFKRIGLPPVVGQILAGVVLGIPVIKAWIFGPEIPAMVDFLSVLGILFLLLLVGLEIDVRKVIESSKESLLISFGSVLVPLVLGFVFLRGMGYDVVASIVFGGALAVTAEGTTVKVLMDAKVLDTRLGVIMVTAGAIDDIFEVLFLSVVTILAHGGTFAELAVFPVELLAFVGVACVSFKIIPRILRYVERKGDDVELFSIVLIFVLVMAALSDVFRVGYLIGAVVSGFLLQVSMRGLKRRDEQEIVETTKLIALAFVVPFFFVNIGLNFDFSTIVGNVILLVATVVIAFSGKILGTLIAKPFSSLSGRQLYLVGWGMNSRGAVELVIALLARNSGLIPPEVFSVLVAMAIVTTLTFPFVLARGIKRTPGIMDAV